MVSLEEILIVKQGEALYGISTEVVAYILRLQELTPVPLAPREIAGLCAIEGSILSALDLSLLISSENEKVDQNSEKSRMVTIRTEEHYFSLLVEEVINAVILDDDELEYVQAESAEQSAAVIALYKHEETIVQVLSIERLVDIIKLPEYVKKSVNDITNADEIESKHLSQTRRYLLFKMGEERFAVNVDETREIIPVPDSYTPIADSQKYITGMMSLREELLVVADLRNFYDLNCADCTKNRIIVIQKSGRAMGVIVDEILDIQDVRDDSISTMPGSFDDEKISGIIQDDNVLTSIVSSNVLESLMESQSHLLKSSHADSAKGSYEDEDTLEVAIFKLSSEEYAFEIDNVAEIIDMSDITEVADTPEYILGVTNIRGQVIPIISLKNRIGVGDGIQDDSKIIVGILNEKHVGFVVDKVMDVSNISQDNIKEQDDSALFEKVLHLDDGKRLVLLMQMNKLLDDDIIESVQEGVA